MTEIEPLINNGRGLRNIIDGNPLRQNARITTNAVIRSSFLLPYSDPYQSETRNDLHSNANTTLNPSTSNPNTARVMPSTEAVYEQKISSKLRPRLFIGRV